VDGALQLNTMGPSRCEEKHVRPIDSPLVSVLIPVFNRATLLPACVLSAIKQSYDNIEIIIVDNASTDATWEVCKSLARDHKCVRIYQNPQNIGPVRNWQRCVSLAQGTYGKLLFSDDMLMPECIEKMINAMGQSNDIAVVSSAVYLGECLDASRIAYSGFGGAISQFDYTAHMIANGLPISPGAMLFRISDLQKNILVKPPAFEGGDFESTGAGPDVLLILLSIGEGKRIFHLTECLNFFRSHSGSFTTGERRREIHDSYRKVLTFFLADNYGPAAADIYLVWEIFKDIARGHPPRSLNTFFQKYYGEQYKKKGLLALTVLIVRCVVSIRLGRVQLPKGRGRPEKYYG
jgi:glycosyltransferase involved in cell wall biosynthesis